MKLESLLLFAALALTPAASHAQAASAPIAPGTRGFVTLRDGDTVLAGSLLSLTPDSVALLAGDTAWTYPLAQVSRIERRGDGSFDGAVRGASIPFLLCLLNCGQGVRNGAHFAQVAATNAAFGAVIGWWIDHKRVGRTTIYPARVDSRDQPRR